MVEAQVILNNFPCQLFETKCSPFGSLRGQARLLHCLNAEDSPGVSGPVQAQDTQTHSVSVELLE
jgi:hypothetical protein